MFVFDYMTDRAFFMEMKEIITGKNLKDPLCQRKEGKAPEQFIDIDDMNEKAIAKTTALGIDDLDEDFYGSDGYNDDELSDLEGYEDDDLHIR